MLQFLRYFFYYMCSFKVIFYFQGVSASILVAAVTTTQPTMWFAPRTLWRSSRWISADTWSGRLASSRS